MMIFLRNEIDTIVGNEEKETCNRSFIIYYGIAHRLDCFTLDSATYDSGMEYSNEGRMEIPAQGDITTYLLNLGKYIYHNRKRGS